MENINVYIRVFLETIFTETPNELCLSWGFLVWAITIWKVWQKWRRYIGKGFLGRSGAVLI